MQLKNFLMDNFQNTNCSYALINVNNKIIPVHFSKVSNNPPFFLESPCVLFKICDITEDIDVFCKKQVCGLLEENEDENLYIEEYIKPMIVDNVFYEILNFQCAPFLDEEVKDVKLISERECLEYLLSTKK